MTKTNEQVWFITGANKGIGAAITKDALDRVQSRCHSAKTEEMETLQTFRS